MKPAIAIVVILVLSNIAALLITPSPDPFSLGIAFAVIASIGLVSYVLGRKTQPQAL